MKNITWIKDLELENRVVSERSKEVRELFRGSRRRMVEVVLRDNGVLQKHKAVGPISVFCLGGSGRFLAGTDLEETQVLRPGTLLTLEAGVEHEVIAEPNLHILVTRFED